MALVILKHLIPAILCSASVLTAQTDIEPWRLEFRMSGGFAGMNRTLEVAGDGEAAAVDCRKKLQATATVAGDDLKRIRSLFSDPAPDSSARNIRCADCIEYSVSFREGARTVKMQFNDPAAGKLEQLAAALTDLLERVLAGNASPASADALNRCR